MRFLLVLFLCGCSLQHGPNPTPSIYYSINVINKAYCAESFKQAQDYLLSYGIVLAENPQSPKHLVCLPTPSWFFRNFNLAYVAGLTGGDVAVVTDDPKVILHELGHLFGLKHSWKGLMFPVDTPFASGFSEKELERLRNGI